MGVLMIKTKVTFYLETKNSTNNTITADWMLHELSAHFKSVFGRYTVVGLKNFLKNSRGQDIPEKPEVTAAQITTYETEGSAAEADNKADLVADGCTVLNGD
jgi:hypothetical protein